MDALDSVQQPALPAPMCTQLRNLFDDLALISALHTSASLSPVVPQAPVLDMCVVSTLIMGSTTDSLMQLDVVVTSYVAHLAT